MWNEAYLDDLLSTPSPALIADFEKLDGDILILGAGGKVGPSLCVMAQRAVRASGRSRRVIAVSRFSDPQAVTLLKENGVELICADLTDPAQIAALPRAENILFMAGRKFGTGENAGATWMMNTAVPAMTAAHFGAARYVVFSTGNIYPFTPLNRGGSTEQDQPGPVGEYAMSCLGRERIFQDAALRLGAKVLLYRLNYAVDLRYGVLCDLAQRILEERPISLKVPAFNCVWQGYANQVALGAFSLAQSPARALNVTGPETVSVREAACQLGQYFNKTPVFQDDPGDTALLSNAGACIDQFGYPQYGVHRLIRWQAQWILQGGRLLNKPTHFEENKGNF